MADSRLKRWLYGIRRFFQQTLLGRALAFASLPLLILAIAFYEPHYQPPIFDAQVHYNEESWKRVRVEAIMNGVEEMNIPWLLVGSTPNLGTWKLWQADPDRVIPMLVPYDTREDRFYWYENPAIIEFLEYELNTRPYRGIGEFHLYDAQADSNVVRRMVELAVERKLVLHARSDPAALHKLFRMGPSLRILWAHAGVDAEPDVIDKMLGRYRNLWVEISHRRDIAPRGNLKPEWEKLMLRYPLRFMLGSGTYSSYYWFKLRTYVADYRDWLQHLPAEVAERIAYRNGLELFLMEYPPMSDIVLKN